MPNVLARANGVVTRGHRVASGTGGDPRFPAGTIAPQLPFLRERIAGFDAWLGGACFPGTINLAFAGRTVRLLAPRHRLDGVAWTELFAPERFWLSECTLVHAGAVRPAFLYIPDPATKPDHAQPADIVELLAAPVPGLRYGDMVELRHDPAAIAISRAPR